MNEPHRIWTLYIVPTVRATETLFWRLAFFSIVVCVLASYNPFKQAPIVTIEAVDFTPIFDLVQLILLCLQMCMEVL